MHISGISRLQEVIRNLAGYDRKGERRIYIRRVCEECKSFNVGRVGIKSG